MAILLGRERADLIVGIPPALIVTTEYFLEP
jgi:hypothetical protein